MRFDLSRLTKPPARRLAGGVAINQPASAELMTPATPASGGDWGAVKANTGGLSPKPPVPPAILHGLYTTPIPESPVWRHES